MCDVLCTGWPRRRMWGLRSMHWKPWRNSLYVCNLLILHCITEQSCSIPLSQEQPLALARWFLPFPLRKPLLYAYIRDEKRGKCHTRPGRRWDEILFLFFLQLHPISHTEILQVTHYLYEHQKHYLPHIFCLEMIIVLTVWGQSHY